MTAWSIGWRMDVVFRGKNTISTLVKFETEGLTWQLSMIRVIFQSSTRNFQSSLQTHYSKISLFIQLLFCGLYSQGRCLTFFKQWGFLNFQITRAAAIPASLTLFFFPQNTFLLWRDMFYLGDINRKDQTRRH